MLEVKIGQNVYRHYRPQVAGKIVEVMGSVDVKRPDGSIYVTSFLRVRVKWVNGKESEHSTAELTDFDELIEDHKRKLKTHLATLAKLRKIPYMGVTRKFRDV